VRSLTRTPGASFMLRWSLTFLGMALVAALLGFGVLAGNAAGLAKILFFVFVAIAGFSFELAGCELNEVGTHKRKRG
jgi:uncharacterized membrane protein YtjA (UPF0391 family)